MANEDGNNPVAFFSKLNPAGSQLLYSTFMGGSGCGGGIGAGYDGLGDVGNAIAVDPNGDVYLAGTTCSPDFPTSANAFDPTNKASYWGGFSTGFVSKFWPLDITPAPLVNGVSTTLNFPETIVGASKTLDVTFTNTGKGSFEVTDFLIDPGNPAEFSGQDTHLQHDHWPGRILHSLGHFFTHLCGHLQRVHFLSSDRRRK